MAPPAPPPRARRVLALGQFISLLIALTGVFTQTLSQSFGVQVPVTQSAGNYLLLSAYLLVPARKLWRDRSYSLEIPVWKYALLALADVEGNFLVVSAYKYTSISSAMLLDCFTIPIVMLLSALFLGAKYTRQHVVAVTLCLGGIVVLVASDVLRDRASWDSPAGVSAAIYGDFLCLLGSAIYACSNVGQEYLVKKQDRRLEFLGMLGLCGFAISAVQGAVLEGRALQAIEWTVSSALCLVGYVCTLFLMYTCTSIFLQDADAAVFNLSLLTSDFFAVVAATYLFAEELSWVYFVGFALIIAGVLVYNNALAPASDADDDARKEGATKRLLPLVSAT